MPVVDVVERLAQGGDVGAVAFESVGNLRVRRRDVRDRLRWGHGSGMRRGRRWSRMDGADREVGKKVGRGARVPASPARGFGFPRHHARKRQDRFQIGVEPGDRFFGGSDVVQDDGRGGAFDRHAFVPETVARACKKSICPAVELLAFAQRVDRIVDASLASRRRRALEVAFDPVGFEQRGDGGRGVRRSRGQRAQRAVECVQRDRAIAHEQQGGSRGGVALRPALLEPGAQRAVGSHRAQLGDLRLAEAPVLAPVGLIARHELGLDICAHGKPLDETHDAARLGIDRFPALANGGHLCAVRAHCAFDPGGALALPLLEQTGHHRRAHAVGREGIASAQRAVSAITLELGRDCRRTVETEPALERGERPANVRSGDSRGTRHRSVDDDDSASARSLDCVEGDGVVGGGDV